MPNPKHAGEGPPGHSVARQEAGPAGVSSAECNSTKRPHSVFPTCGPQGRKSSQIRRLTPSFLR